MRLHQFDSIKTHTHCTGPIHAHHCSTKDKSAHMVKLCGDVSSRRAATSRANSSAISTLSFVGVSSSSTMISRAKASCATCWLHRWAMNFRQPTAMPLSLRLKAFRNCRRMLLLGSKLCPATIVTIAATTQSEMHSHAQSHSHARHKDTCLYL